MNSKSKLMIGIAAVALFGAAGATAFADDYNAGGRARHDDQAEQTRQLNQAALDQARDQNDADDSDNDSDDDAGIAPGDGRDASGDDDDDDDDDAGPDKDGDVTN